MSVADQIIKSAQNLSDARKAIILKGGSVGDTPAFNNLADEINTIPVWDENYALVEDTDTAYQKTILSGALSPAKLKSIGGMTYSRLIEDGNLLPYPLAVASDRGVITVTGDDPFDTWISERLVNSINPITLPAGTYCLDLNPAVVSGEVDIIDGGRVYNVYVNDLPSEDNETEFTLDKETVVTNLAFDYELSLNEIVPFTVTLSPVLRRADETVEFTPRTYELLDTKVTEVKSYGTNFFDIKMVRGSKNVVNNGDSLTITATAGSTGVAAGSPNTLIDYCPNLKVGETYTLSAKTTGSSKIIHLIQAQISWSFGTSLQMTEDILNSTVYWYSSGMSTTATISEIMVNQGKTTIPYKPYHAYTYKIPEALQALEGYGSSGSYIDFERNVFVNGETENPLPAPFNNNIEIDAGGTVEFVNENGYAVPSNITYLRRIS